MATERARIMYSTTTTSERLVIFDTTLRDGEQSPGASMNLAEKLEVAHALKDLGVDVIEAGFPIASPGDFEAVQAVPRHGQGPGIFAPAPRKTARNGQGRPPPAHTVPAPIPQLLPYHAQPPPV